jgi:hypothetical protein
LSAQPAPTIFLEVGSTQSVEKELHFIAQVPRINRSFGRDRLPPFRRTDERVDEPVDVTI